MKNTKFLLALVIYIALFSLCIIRLLPKDTYSPMVDGQTVSGNWVLSKTHDTEVYLKNTVSGESTEVFGYLYYNSPDDLFGKVYHQKDADYLVVRIDNEGSNDTLYYSVFKITEHSATKVMTKNFVWACSNPVKRGNVLHFYGDKLSEDMNCFFLVSQNVFYKRKVGTITLE